MAFRQTSAPRHDAAPANSVCGSALSILSTVHPRVCGELSPSTVLVQTRSGSSPRVRGTPLRAGAVAPGRRFIPACAGNSRASWPPTCRPAVHPRVCGELGLALRDAEGNTRFIPACAGNSRVPRSVFLGLTVHPRVCGELSMSDSTSCSGTGSSPRVRGTQPRRGGRPPRWRFIPACAGNSDLSPRRCERTPVHPRVCGELRRRRAVERHAHGSSPRVRGTPRPRAARRAPPRFIPACAGNSNPTAASVTAAHGSSPRVRGTQPAPLPAITGLAVHPRVCGELRSCSANAALATGSSPRVRGTLAQDEAVPRHVRFIPACAGNSAAAHHQYRACTGSSPRVRGTRPAARGQEPGMAVHPRVCGELDKLPRGWHPIFGSSPRVRGTHLQSGRPRPRSRFIPACAGNSHAAPGCLTPTTVHPRVCGELLRLPRSTRSLLGSSPRVRGTRPWTGIRAARLSVHPRVCGELPRVQVGQRGGNGSSPRVRGTQP